MKLIDVIPISRGIGKEHLSYFTSKDITLGTIVSVPIRSRTSKAIVVSVKDVSMEKSRLRSLDYPIKKIEKIKSSRLLSPHFIRAAQDIAEYFAGSTGSVLNLLIPKTILDESEELKIQEIKPPKTHHETLILQSSEQERFAHYKSLIREAFAKKQSVLFILPTIFETEKFASELGRGIEQYAYTLHGSIPKKEIVLAWRKAVSEKHQVCIFATGAFLSIPRDDLGSIIVEHETSRAYKLLERPYLDIRTCAEYIAKCCGIELILGGTLLRAETILRYQNMEIAECAPPKFRSIKTASQKVIDMRERFNRADDTTLTISKELGDTIHKAVQENEHVFIFNTRRGISPITVCSDCSSIELCSSCGSSISLHKSKPHNIFLCHTCGAMRSADERCQTCSSWRLKSIGIGLELIEEHIRKLFPQIPLMRLDRDSIKSGKQAAETMKKFLATPGSILLGTEMALTYLSANIEHTAVATIDSLLSIPNFRINERLMDILLTMRSKAIKTFIIQTRIPELNTIRFAVQGNLSDFYREELKMRKSLSYPPFGVLVKIALSGKREKVKKEMENLQTALSNYNTYIVPAFIPKGKGVHAMHCLIKLKADEWPQRKLLNILQSLPQQLSIQVDPESVL